jgi:hypothetical protein
MPNDDRSVIHMISLNGKEPAAKQHRAQYKADEASIQTAPQKLITRVTENAMTATKVMTLVRTLKLAGLKSCSGTARE